MFVNNAPSAAGTGTRGRLGNVDHRLAQYQVSAGMFLCVAVATQRAVLVQPTDVAGQKFGTTGAKDLAPARTAACALRWFVFYGVPRTAQCLEPLLATLNGPSSVQMGCSAVKLAQSTSVRLEVPLRSLITPIRTAYDTKSDTNKTSPFVPFIAVRFQHTETGCLGIKVMRPQYVPLRVLANVCLTG